MYYISRFLYVDVATFSIYFTIRLMVMIVVANILANIMRQSRKCAQFIYYRPEILIYRDDLSLVRSSPGETYLYIDLPENVYAFELPSFHGHCSYFASCNIQHLPSGSPVAHGKFFILSISDFDH